MFALYPFSICAITESTATRSPRGNTTGPARSNQGLADIYTSKALHSALHSDAKWHLGQKLVPAGTVGGVKVFVYILRPLMPAYASYIDRNWMAMARVVNAGPGVSGDSGCPAASRTLT